MSLGLIGKKSGMSRVFQEDGDSIPVSIVSVFGNYVAGIKTKEADGYDAVLVSKTENKKSRSKSQKEFFKHYGYIVLQNQLTYIQNK